MVFAEGGEALDTYLLAPGATAPGALPLEQTILRLCRQPLPFDVLLQDAGVGHLPLRQGLARLLGAGRLQTDLQRPGVLHRRA
jgi:hypothetical protein